MTRKSLPNRRQSTTVETSWEGHGFTVTIGFDSTGRPSEVFAGHSKGHMHAIIADACILASIALQHGASPAELAKSLGKTPGFVNGEEALLPASPLGAIAAAIMGVME